MTDPLPSPEPLIEADTLEAWYRALRIGGQLRQRLERFCERLLEENQRLNLTAIREPAAARVLLVAESLAVLPRIDAREPKRLADLGTGGGIPGLPIAIARPTLRLTLIDATRKKLAAIERICADLEIRNVRTCWGRAERLAREKVWRERFDAVVARAVGKLPQTLAWLSGLLRPAGFGWIFQSLRALDAPQPWLEAAREHRLSLEAAYRYTLPEDHGPWLLLELRKTGPLRRTLPRL